MGSVVKFEDPEIRRIPLSRSLSQMPSIQQKHELPYNDSLTKSQEHIIKDLVGKRDPSLDN